MRGCPNRICDDRFTLCRLVPALKMAKEGSVNYPCNRCYAEWKDGVPPSEPTAILIAKINTQGDVKPSRGLGDTIAKFTHATGIDKVVEAIAGKDCGCKKRQEALNKLVPYKG